MFITKIRNNTFIHHPHTSTDLYNDSDILTCLSWTDENIYIFMLHKCYRYETKVEQKWNECGTKVEQKWNEFQRPLWLGERKSWNIKFSVGEQRSKSKGTRGKRKGNKRESFGGYFSSYCHFSGHICHIFVLLFQ